MIAQPHETSNPQGIAQPLSIGRTKSAQSSLCKIYRLVTRNGCCRAWASHYKAAAWNTMVSTTPKMESMKSLLNRSMSSGTFLSGPEEAATWRSNCLKRGSGVIGVQQHRTLAPTNVGRDSESLATQARRHVYAP